MSATDMGFLPAKDMSGYWPAGRGAICCRRPSHWPSDWPSEKRKVVPPTSSFKIDHLSTLKEEVDVVWAMGAILMKMSVFVKENALRVNHLFHYGKKWSLVDFQIGNERKREFRPAEIRFYLHKEFRAADIRLYLHKDCRSAGTRLYLHKDCCAAGIRVHLHKDVRVAGIEFSLHKEFHKKNHDKSMVYSKNFRAARDNLLRIYEEKSWQINDIFKNFPALRAPIC